MSVLGLLQTASPEKSWKYWILPEEDDKAWEYVRNHPEKSYNLRDLMSRKNLNWEIVEQYLANNQLDCNIRTIIIRRQDFKWNLVEKYPDHWNKYDLNSAAVMDFSVISKLSGGNLFNWATLSERATDTDVRSYPTLPWNNEYLTKNTKVSINTLLEFSLYNGWFLTDRKDFKLEHLAKLKNKLYNCNELTERFSLDEIFSIPEFNWDWNIVIKKEGFSWDKFDINKEWYWGKLSHVIPLSIALKYDKPWNWASLSCRNDLTWLVVYCHLDKPWDMQNIEYKFSGKSTKETTDKIVKIQKWWLKRYYRPNGRKALSLKSHFEILI